MEEDELNEKIKSCNKVLAPHRKQLQERNKHKLAKFQRGFNKKGMDGLGERIAEKRMELKKIR